jgi:regulator of sigma E protease
LIFFMAGLYSFLILSLLVLAHEGGHFFLAKKSGIKVEEFGLGIPPRLWGIRVGETVYSINLLPFGGFVRLYGEEGKVGKDKERAFSNKSRKVRIGVLLAGVVMNFVLAMGLFGLVYSVLGIPEQAGQVEVLTVMENSPAAKAGLEENDIIVAVAGREIDNTEDFVEIINQRRGESVTLELSRGGENPCREDGLEHIETEGDDYLFCQSGQLHAVVVPRENPPDDEGAIGVIISDTKMRHYSFGKMFPKAIYNGAREAYFWAEQMAFALGQILKGVFSGQGVPEGIAGPVGVYQATKVVFQSGFWALAHFAGILSINLAVFNLIPFPALDGGRIAFVLAEGIIGKKRRERIERWANQIGMVLLIGLLVAVTLGDLRRLLG